VKLRINATTANDPDAEHGMVVDLIMTPTEMRAIADALEKHAAGGAQNAIAYQAGLGTVCFVRSETKLVTLAAPGGLVKA
jgi:hypothetical protein